MESRGKEHYEKEKIINKYDIDGNLVYQWLWDG